MTLDEWQDERQVLLAKLEAWCGAFPARGELHPQELWRHKYATHTEIKLTYDGELGERIPACLLIPRATYIGIR
jgi:hypothetical protein